MEHTEASILERIDSVVAELQASGCTVSHYTAGAMFGSAIITVSDSIDRTVAAAALMLCDGNDLTVNVYVHGYHPDGGEVRRSVCILFSEASVGGGE